MHTIPEPLSPTADPPRPPPLGQGSAASNTQSGASVAAPKKVQLVPVSKLRKPFAFFVVLINLERC